MQGEDVIQVLTNKLHKLDLPGARAKRDKLLVSCPQHALEYTCCIRMLHMPLPAAPSLVMALKQDCCRQTARSWLTA